MENNAMSGLAIVGLIAVLLTGTIVIGSQMMPIFGNGYGMHGGGMMMHGDYNDHDGHDHDDGCDMDDVHSEEQCEEYYDNYGDASQNPYSNEFEECDEHMHEHYEMGYGC